MESIVALGAALLLVRVGQTLYFSGLSRAKNAAGAAVRNLCDLCVASLAFWAVGAAVLLQQSNAVFGVRPDRLLAWGGVTDEMFFYAALILVGTGVVGGSLAERSKFFPLCAVSALLGAVVLPVGGFWAWRGGWLGRLGFVDVAGASVLHVAAGACALAGAVAVGARTGKYNRDGSTNMIPGHSVPFTAAGVVTMVVAFFPYVLGCTLIHTGSPHSPSPSTSAAAQAAMNLLLSVAAGGLAALLLGQFRYGKPDIGLALLGALGGAVAVTAGADRVGAPAAVVTGAVAGVVVPLSSISLDLLGHVDDPGAGVSVHLVGGAWGTLAAGVFLPAASIGQRLEHVGIQLLGLVVIAALAAGLCGGLFFALRAAGKLRATEADEYDGLDLAEHDIGAYPDFQQTMIKSYHLREA